VRNQIPLDELFDAASFALKASIYKIMPGVVTGYHAAVAGKSQASVDVQPGVADVRVNTETGAIYFEPWDIIPTVPLAMAMGGGGGIAFALAKGNGVTLISWDLDPTLFRKTGAASNPLDTHRHGGGHWLALPFDITDANAQADPGPNVVVAPPPGGALFVGANAANFVALANLVDSAITAIVSKFNSHTHVVSSFGSASAVPVPLISPAPGSTACTLLKAT
jgi:hypothetical protein